MRHRRRSRAGPHRPHPLIPVALVVLVLAPALVACAGKSGAGLVAGTLSRPPPSTTPVEETAASVAARLGSVETAIRLPSAPEAEIADLGRRQQDLYRIVVSRPEWQPDVLALVPEAVRAAVAANIAAGTALTRLAEPRAELPRWRIVAPAPAATLMAHYKAAAAEMGVEWEYLAAINLVETRMGRIRGDSSAGARGPMQFLPATWEIYGEGGDINSDRDAIFAAARLLKSRGAPTNMERALFAYNNSNSYVRAISAYAEVIRAGERAYAAYHAWQVYYGDVLLPEGFANP